jgi:hypothetical protein
LDAPQAGRFQVSLEDEDIAPFAKALRASGARLGRKAIKQFYAIGCLTNVEYAGAYS